MFNTIIISLTVMLIVALCCYLVHDSAFAGLVVSSTRTVIKRAKKAGRPSKAVKIANGPVVMIKSPGDYVYSSVTLEKDSVKIGRSPKNDIVLDDATVESVHARIDKKMKGNKVYYEFINLSKRNPAENLNQKARDYEYLGYRRGKILDDSEVFYIGNTKIIFKTPVKNHMVSKTDRLLIDGNADDISESLRADTREVRKTRRMVKKSEKTINRIVDKYANL